MLIIEVYLIVLVVFITVHFVCIYHSNVEELVIIYSWLHNENSA